MLQFYFFAVLVYALLSWFSEARYNPAARMLAKLVEAPVVLRTTRTYSQSDLRQSARDHDELVAAFAARDGDWARAVMGSHLRRAFHTFAKTVGPRADDAANDQDGTER